MTTSKKVFGQFVTSKRQAAGLTQRELADRLFVTESAVSKWERGVSYPDISLVTLLAAELDVREGELINASDDPALQRAEREARVYNRWKTSILWSTASAYAVALTTCFIVNWAVDDTLSWFWVVLTAVGVAFSLTTLPLLPLPHRGWTVLGAFLGALFALFAVTWSMYGRGNWLPITVASVAFSAVVLLGPTTLRSLRLPLTFSSHRTVVALAVDTVALVVLLTVVMVASGNVDQLWSRALPIAGLALVFPWGAAMAIRYLPMRGLYRAAIVTAAAGGYNFLAFNPLLHRLVDGRWGPAADLTQWHGDYVNGNVSTLVFVSCLLVAAFLAIAATLRGHAAEPVG